VAGVPIQLTTDLLVELPPEALEAIAREVARILAAAPAQPTSGWMTATQAAEHLGWPVQRVYKLTAAGAIPHRKHGQRLLFDRTELDEWLDGYAHGRRRSAFHNVSKLS
jgi:excisionase family DNA binding protein